ncbi:MAG: hypothetical protein JO257_06470 [Deltaproteobacteria bacterium]|nr:hypothetical protein [Deltaproteobacteria bacterium]
MKKLLMLSLLAACELQPAPKQAPSVGSAAAPAAASAVAVQAPPPAGSAVAVQTPPPAGSAVGSAAGSVAAPTPVPRPAVQATAECEKAAVRFAELFIAGAPASQRGIFEQDRANTVRRTEIACTQQGWTPAALACIDQSKNDRDARACLEKFPPPGATPPGAGSNGKPYHPPRD